MIYEDSTFLIKKNNNYQIIMEYMVESRYYDNISSRPILTKVFVESQNNQSDMNIIKGQKTMILKSFLGNRAKFSKTDDTVKMSFSSTDAKNIYKALVLVEYFKGHLSFNDNKLTSHFEDILIKLRRLDFFKINRASLTDISIGFEYNKNIDYNTIIWYKDEICI